MKDKEKLEHYEMFLAKLHYCSIAMNSDKIRQLIKNAAALGYAHNCGNGMQSDEECQNNIDKKIRNLSNAD